jgi:hypothetical protein
MLLNPLFLVMMQLILYFLNDKSFLVAISSPYNTISSLKGPARDNCRLNKDTFADTLNVFFKVINSKKLTDFSNAKSGKLFLIC